MSDWRFGSDDHTINVFPKNWGYKINPVPCGESASCAVVIVNTI